MPHLIMQYSSNIIEEINFSDLFSSCHLLLAEMLPTNISSCSSRAIMCSDYWIGNGEANNAFIYVNIKILPGREIINLKNISNKILDIFKDHFSESFKKLNLQLSVEIVELKEIYSKCTSK